MNRILENKKKGGGQRQSGIEGLRILALLFIIISHAILALGGFNGASVYGDVPFFISLATATTNVQVLIINIMIENFGIIGNNIFFICSAWFLLDTLKTKKNIIEKNLRMILDSWIISILFLILFYCLGFNLNVRYIVSSLVPIIKANNWYLTAYLIIFSIHPYLNMIIECISKKELLTLNIICFISYYIFCFILKSGLLANRLTYFIVVYLIVAYIKKYLPNVVRRNNVKRNLLIIGVAGYIGIMLCLNFLGLTISFFTNKLMVASIISNPFLLMIAIALFLIFNEIKSYSKIVNIIGGMSLYVYLIHDNILVRNYLLPLFYKNVYGLYGYDQILFWIFLFAVIIFSVSIILSFIYKISLQKITISLSKHILLQIKLVYENIIGKIMRIQ